MVYLILAILGLAMGSFVNAFVWRLHEQQELEQRPKGQRRSKKQPYSRQDLSIVTGRSLCQYCGHTLAARDLVPVLSYLWLRGKCRYCHRPIEDTPAAELLVPVLFLFSYRFWPFGLKPDLAFPGTALFGFWLVFLVGFVILALYDLKWYLLPDKVVFPLIGLASLDIAVQAWLTSSWLVVVNALFAVACLAGLFEVLYLVSQGRWIGFGDVKLAIVLGLLAGTAMQAIMVIFIASLLGSLAAAPLLVRGQVTIKSRLPFGPFLLAGTVIVVLFGGTILSWYGHVLGIT